jgi:hypothetical protein
VKNELLSAYIDLVRTLSSQNPLAEVVRAQQATIDKMQATLDRIVMSKFDAPLERHVHPQPDNQMNLWNLTDQDVPSAPSVIERGLASLNVESDAVFLESVQ